MFFMSNHFKRIAIKVGSNVLTNENGHLDDNIIQQLVRQIANVVQAGTEVVLISSGAVASGRSIHNLKQKLDTVSSRQLLSAIGQVKLINQYSNHFQKQNLQVAQVLVTKEDFRTRTHYLNMKNCLQVLLGSQIIPIVNENDVVAITELMFTDNDELAGLVANMINADALILLSNIDGVYNGDPSNPQSEIIEEVRNLNTDFSKIVTHKKSEFGRGGMITKCNMAAKIAATGLHVFIANGKSSDIIFNAVQGKKAGTHFIPESKVQSGLKKWLAHSGGYSKGRIMINEGALHALKSKQAISVLPVGIIKLFGEFRKGDLLEIATADGVVIGWGVAQYGHEKAGGRIGQHNQKPLIHYDYLYIK